MSMKVKELAPKVCEYTITTKNKRIFGTYEVENRNFKIFLIEGEQARELHQEIIKNEEL
ncbi:MAG: hypothetical protein OEY01_11230 [Desulfobulbaceae bacterium]|nr:hypothetical protein [Desulfobulbaceae bacterium]